MGENSQVQPPPGKIRVTLLDHVRRMFGDLSPVNRPSFTLKRLRSDFPMELVLHFC